MGASNSADSEGLIYFVPGSPAVGLIMSATSSKTAEAAVQRVFCIGLNVKVVCIFCSFANLLWFS